jgi:group I intron endonuclease
VQIYVLIDPRNNELRYVGLTTQPLAKRFHNHLDSARRGASSHVYNWMRQVMETGQVPLIVQIESCDSLEELCEREVDFMAYFKSIGCRLTNQAKGGSRGMAGFKHSEETCAKMSLSRLGKPTKRSGYKHSPETLMKMSLAKKGKPTARLNYKATDETKRRMSESKKGQNYGPPSEEHKRKVAVAHYRSIKCLDTGVIYKSIQDAAATVGTTPQNISNMLTGRSRTAAGYRFAYLENEEVRYA